MPKSAVLRVPNFLLRFFYPYHFFSKIYWLFTKGGKKKFLKALKNDHELKRRKKDAKKAFDTLYSKRASAKKATNKWLKSKGVKPIV